MLNVSVVICAYNSDRWRLLKAAVASLLAQDLAPLEIIVVIDHNPALLERVRGEWPGVLALANREPRGLSGARNSGVLAARGEVIAFLDDDAIASEDWIRRLSAGYEDSNVIGVGGEIRPLWEGRRPNWFPEEFDWVVGCTYRGLPESPARVRNLIGCNMSFRRQVFQVAGHFRSGLGREGTVPLGCEETEFCIRAGECFPAHALVYEPRALVYHYVPAARATLSYFRARCFAEGISKSQVTALVGRSPALSSEWQYARQTLPRAVLRNLRGARRDPAGLARAGTVSLGLGITAIGYLRGELAERVKKGNRLTGLGRGMKGVPHDGEPG
jgi:glycosyltransferase involved in cell wall biosynthesis